MKKKDKLKPDKAQIRIFDRENGRIHVSKNRVYAALFSDYEKTLDLVIDDRAKLFQPSASYAWLSTDKFLLKEYKCPTRKCNMKFDRTDAFKDHLKRCHEGVKVTTKQRVFGQNKTHLERAVELGYLPEHLLGFRMKYICVFDIETAEISQKTQISEITSIEGRHRLLSLAVSTNLPKEDLFLMRDSSDPQAEQDLIDKFVNHLENLHLLLADQIPHEFATAIGKLEAELETLRFGPKKVELNQLLKNLKQYYVLRIYAFNGGKQFK